MTREMSTELRAAIAAGNRRRWEDPDYRRRNTESHRRVGGSHITAQGYRCLVSLSDHPLARRGTVLEHRQVLYDKIGPGPHACHWQSLSGCGKVALEWGGTAGIQADHLDGVKLNNEPDNLVPSCMGCNRRGMRLGAARALNQNVLKDRCPQGHALVEFNLEPWALRTSGRRRCKACHRAHSLVRKYPEKEFVVEADRIYRKLGAR